MLRRLFRLSSYRGCPSWPYAKNVIVMSCSSSLIASFIVSNFTCFAPKIPLKAIGCSVFEDNKYSKHVTQGGSQKRLNTKDAEVLHPAEPFSPIWQNCRTAVHQETRGRIPVIMSWNVGNAMNLIVSNCSLSSVFPAGASAPLIT